VRTDPLTRARHDDVHSAVARGLCEVNFFPGVCRVSPCSRPFGSRFICFRVTHHSSTVTVSNRNMQGTGCPFAAAAKNDTSSISLCPFASKLRPAADDTPAAPAATCPLGFGTSRGPKLSTLHCPVCKGLLFDAHKVISCQHTFCRSCISQTRDCPSCGRDVDRLEPNSELAGKHTDSNPCFLPYAVTTAPFTYHTFIFVYTAKTWSMQLILNSRGLFPFSAAGTWAA
jgi:hypothetical protein